MSRHRPPQPQSSAYITREGYQCLSEESTTLWKTRAEVVDALSAAAAEGDRSENAEYIYRKKQLREIDRRLRYLQKRLEELVIVDRLPTDRSRIYFGAWVRLEDSDGQEVIYRIVGPDEFDLTQGYISMDSPVAKALMKKTVDDEVVVQRPNGEMTYYVAEVSYEGM